MQQPSLVNPEPPILQVPTYANRVRFLVVMLFVSLGLHAVTIFTLYQVRTTIRGQVAALAGDFEAAKGDVISLNVPIKMAVPVNTDVPINKTIVVPIDTTITLDTTFDVPLNTPFGTYTIPVPIKGDVPIKLSAPVSLNETIPVSTTIMIDSQIPFEVPISDTPIASYLDRLYQTMLAFAEQL